MSLHPIRNSFNAGEITPYGLGRTDLQKYGSGCEQLWNYLPLIQGPITNRPGTRYIVPAMGPSRLIPFALSATKAYVLEFGDKRLRFYTDTAQIVQGPAAPAWNATVGGTTADGATLIWTTRGFVYYPGGGKNVALNYVIIDSNGNLQICTTAGTTATLQPFPLLQPLWATAPGATTDDGTVVWTCLGVPQWVALTAEALNAALYTPVGIVQCTTAGTSGSGAGPAPYEIPTPYDTSVDNLWDLKFAQDADIMYLAHPNHSVYKLSRLGDAQWILSQPAFRPPPLHGFDQDVGSANADHAAAITVAPAATFGTGIAFTASAPIFIAGDVGKQIISAAGAAYITALTGTTAVDPNTGATLYPGATCDILDAFASTAAIAAGGWFLRGGPQSYASYGFANSSGDFVASRKLGIGGEQTVLSFKQFMADGTAVAGNYEDAFRLVDAGRYLVAAGTVAQITAVNGSAEITVRLMAAIADTYTDTNANIRAQPQSGGSWDLESPSFSAVNGWPAAVCFFQDRLCFAGTAAQPQNIWCSVTGDYENFAKGPLDDDALDEAINSGFRETIQWLAPYQGMIACGTLQSEYILTGGALAIAGNGPAITPSNFAASMQSRYGVSSIQPVFVENDLIYIQRAKQTAYQFSYDIYRSIYGSTDLTLLANLIASAGFKEMVYAARPFFTMWFTDLAGNLVSLVYMREQQVTGWSRHFTGQDLWPNGGASVRSGDQIIADAPPAAPDQFISVCSIPDPSGLMDQVWLLTARTVNGAQGYMIEVLDQTLYVDCASSAVFGSAVTQISGLQYLQGRTVRINADGADLGTFVVPSSGTISFQQVLPEGGKNIQVGLPFVPHCLTTRLEVPAGGQTVQGLLKRWSKSWVRLYNQTGGSIGLQELITRTPQDDLTAAVPPYTGDLEVRNLGYDREGRVTIEQAQALPSTVLALFGTVEVGAN